MMPWDDFRELNHSSSWRDYKAPIHRLYIDIYHQKRLFLVLVKRSKKRRLFISLFNVPRSRSGDGLCLFKFGRAYSPDDDRISSVNWIHYVLYHLDSPSYSVLKSVGQNKKKCPVLNSSGLKHQMPPNQIACLQNSGQVTSLDLPKYTDTSWKNMAIHAICFEKSTTACNFAILPTQHNSTPSSDLPCSNNYTHQPRTGSQPWHQSQQFLNGLSSPCIPNLSWP